MIVLSTKGRCVVKSLYLGEIVAWSWPKNHKTFKYTEVLKALVDSGLDTKYARQRKPGNAFIRACREMEENRIIRKLPKEKHSLAFQFTEEFLKDDQYTYGKGVRLEVDKDTGIVTGKDAGLVSLATRLMKETTEQRTVADVTTIVNRLYAASADLFPVRDQGGCYFVPDQHKGFTNRVEQFVSALGGRLRRWELPAGGENAKKSVKETVADGLRDLIDQHKMAVDELGKDSREDAFQNAARKIQETKFKVECYLEYLGDQQDEVRKQLTEAQDGLRKKIESLGGIEDDDEDS